ncbi:MAG: lyase domain protein repeat-containing protein, partial [Deltaproteobacteria bacterium]|nr:lyase domain protein repeat-containing protein [Deltaproteobacteria bacterium]
MDSLIAELGHRNSAVREAAARALGVTGDPRAVEPLLNALGDAHDAVRHAAAQGLKALGEPLGELIAGSLAGSEAARQELAARGDPRALPPLSGALGAWDVSVRVHAA